MNDTTVIATDPQVDDVRAYVGAVRAWLGDLPPEEVEDLTAGMEADLAERAAESGGTLGALLGEPEAYAAELRSAAGLPPRWVPVGAAAPDPGALRSLRASIRASGDDAVRRFPWLRDLRPSWWLARGAVAGWVVAVGARHVELAPAARRCGRCPSGSVGAPRPAGCRRGAAGSLAAGNALAIVLLLPADGGAPRRRAVTTRRRVPAFAPAGLSTNGESVQNLYAYDAAGNRLEDVRLFDQNGQPVQVWPGAVAGPIGPDGQEIGPWLTDERSLGVFPLRLSRGQRPVGRRRTARGCRRCVIAPLGGSAEPTPGAGPSATASPSAGAGATASPTPVVGGHPGAEREQHAVARTSGTSARAARGGATAYSGLAPVAQLAEAGDLKSPQVRVRLPSGARQRHPRESGGSRTE